MVTKDVICRVISGDSKDVVKGLLTKVPITQLDHDIDWVSNKVASGTPWSLENVSIKKVGGGSRDIIPDLLSSATAVNVIHKNRTGVSTEIEFVMPVVRTFPSFHPLVPTLLLPYLPNSSVSNFLYLR